MSNANRLQSQSTRIQEVLSKTSNPAVQIDEIAKIRGWFRPEDESPNYSLVQAYVQGTTSLSNASEELFGRFDAELKARAFTEGDGRFLDLWYSILHSAKRISFREADSHSKLVELVKAFQNHEEKPHKGDAGVFRSLADFGLALSEAVNDSPGTGAGFSAPEIYAWTNVNYFWARLQDEGVIDRPFDIWALRQALEYVHQDHGPSDAHIAGTANQKYDAYVPAAAVWVLVLGRNLYVKEKDLTPTDRKYGNPAKGGDLWTGVAGYTKERWALWKKRFGEVSEMEELQQDTRDIAKEAVEAMDKAES